MTLLVMLSGWLVAAAVLAVVMGRAIRRMDAEDRAHRDRMDQWETHRRERFRRAMEDRQ